MPTGPPARAVPGEESLLGEPPSSRSAPQQVARIAELRRVHRAFAWFRSHARELEELQLQATAIPAPPWGEAARSQWLTARFAELSLADVQQDELGNVFGILRSEESRVGQ